MRVDKFLFENGLAKSRTHAADLVKSGLVSVNSKAISKPSLDVMPDDDVIVTGENCPFVSRGGLKLTAAIETFGISVTDKKCVDIGASSGGFTDVLLQKGAEIVYAVDSGHGQLDKKLVCDSRVINIEGYNARALSPEITDGQVDIAVCDLSFISQTYIHEPLTHILSDGGIFVSLVKPQFEGTKESVSKGGIVKNPKFRAAAIEKVISSLDSFGICVKGLVRSPISGGDGNTEYLIYSVKDGRSSEITTDQIKKVVYEECNGDPEKR